MALMSSCHCDDSLSGSPSFMFDQLLLSCLKPLKVAFQACQFHYPVLVYFRMQSCLLYAPFNVYAML